MIAHSEGAAERIARAVESVACSFGPYRTRARLPRATGWALAPYWGQAHWQRTQSQFLHARYRHRALGQEASSDSLYDHFVQGITGGWMDIYDWYLPDQHMEVNGVPDGVYLLQTEADPDRLLVEANRSNNCGGVYIQLSNMTAISRSARILGPESACAGTAR